jgi:hypothetical protein
LDGEEVGEIGREGGVDVVGELAAFVFVAEEVAGDGEERAQGLGWDVPSATGDLVVALVGMKA